jgi:hypothetical protein
LLCRLTQVLLSEAALRQPTLERESDMIFARVSLSVRELGIALLLTAIPAERAHPRVTVIR